ncbi:acylneuraminate cytidylyltransferase family protein [Leptospira limi]|uniref:Acylneuraminate cytidylyltransferase family protein n=1 Tax=Leptospira limi TaxID=2950023 RepID=A0ABT3LZ20_9LEPT|nr:acylneuraminate cytidylyltransferase family protein [Leptospira limi]MCW7462972.1 acylneuraminate cytidylyltransferase family protein [Leptospira limi]
MKDKKIRAIIAARGGSKGVPGKNIRNLGGKPLIEWSIEDALESKYIQEVYVSTDDEKIANISKSAGAKIINRPAMYATDKSSSEEAIIHAISEWDEMDPENDIIVFMQCTSPIRSSADLDEAIEKLISMKADSLLSVCEFHGFLWKEDGNNAIPWHHDYKIRPMRQDMEKRFKENGSFYIFKPWVILKDKNRLGGKIITYEMDQSSSIDIDTEFDFKLAEIFIKNA